MNFQKEKPIFDFLPICGMGTVTLKDGSPQDVYVYGQFREGNYRFIIHQDAQYPDYYAASEVSTGCKILEDCYESFEHCLDVARKRAYEKRLYFSTIIGNRLINLRRNLDNRNLSPLPVWTTIL